MCFYSSDDNMLNGTLPSSLFEVPKLSVLNLGKFLIEGKRKKRSKLLFFAN